MVLFSEENRRSAWIKRLQRVLLCLIDGPYACSIASVDRKRRPGDKRRGLGTEIEYCIRCIFRPGFAPQRNTPAHTPDVFFGQRIGDAARGKAGFNEVDAYAVFGQFQGIALCQPVKSGLGEE